MGRIANGWINGFSKLGIDNSKVPTAKYLNKISNRFTGWKFIQTDEQYADPVKWNQEIYDKKMSISNFVRTPEELFYCSQPDKWHDIIGHIPWLLDPVYSRMYRDIAMLYIDAFKKGGDKMRLEVGNINWFVTEVGIIKENGRLKAFGATLYSSSGELERAFNSKPKVCSLQKLISLPSYDRSDLQDQYFVIDSIDQVNQMVADYRRKYL